MCEVVVRRETTTCGCLVCYEHEERRTAQTVGHVCNVRLADLVLSVEVSEQAMRRQNR